MAEPSLESLVRVALERVLAREAAGGAAAGEHVCTGTGTCGGDCAATGVCAKKGTSTSASANPAPAAVAAPIPTPAEAAHHGEVAVASDHGGFELKQDLVRYLKDLGYRVRDLGPPTGEAVDYPDYALMVAAAVAKGDAWRGIMVDGVGIGSGMAANKVPGIRAAPCFDVFSTRNAREHNDANVLCLGGRVLEPAKAREMARTFLGTEFGGDRHARRVDKIVAIERLFLGAGASGERGGGFGMASAGRGGSRP